MAWLYADENFPLPVIAELRRLGHDVLTALEADQANQLIPDFVGQAARIDAAIKSTPQLARQLLRVNRPSA